jgi:hypothetical protein
MYAHHAACFDNVKTICKKNNTTIHITKSYCILFSMRKEISLVWNVMSTGYFTSRDACEKFGRAKISKWAVKQVQLACTWHVP